ncbi:MAG: hypothetical protein ACFFAN_08035 [Promethearchaeota archaeon]
MKFKELNEGYKFLYKNVYDINEDDINKASFVIFSLSFTIITIISIYFISINILFIIFYSLILSLIISYRFNLTLYRRINKEESIINALIYLIKINFSLIKKTLKKNSDYCIAFIELIKDYHLPISENFKIILRKIHEGAIPEEELLNIITPSEDFNLYLRDLLVNHFSSDYDFNRLEETNSEKKFKVVLRDIESKMSVIFFIGLFFPIGLCFIILLQKIHTFFLIVFIPLFLILLNFLFRKFIKIDILLIGLLKEYSRVEKEKFDEFLVFLKALALNLSNNISPENAFINAYSQNKKFFKQLHEQLGLQLSRLLNFSCSFDELINFLKLELNSFRYNLILDTIKRMLDESAYYTSDKILEILDIISKHRRLEKKLGIIIKGEKFKVLLFILLLPLIIGAIGGMLPLLAMITTNFDGSDNLSYNDYLNLINLVDLAIIFIILLLSNSITCYYFLKIVYFEKKFLIIFISDIFFILSFLLSFSNLIMMI